MYASFAVAGFTGLILMRALWLTASAPSWPHRFRRTGAYYRSFGAAFAAVRPPELRSRSSAIRHLRLSRDDHPDLESRKRLWVSAAPPDLGELPRRLHHGWVVMGAYCAESLYLRFRGKPGRRAPPLECARRRSPFGIESQRLQCHSRCCGITARAPCNRASGSGSSRNIGSSARSQS